ncbi:MAG: hypothetical protein LBR65_08355 [Culturomica sp.]|nr:hypothetical protein [Culturomica sp.]
MPDGSGIIVKRTLLLHSGQYVPEEYADFKAFIEAVAEADRAGIVLKIN